MMYIITFIRKKIMHLFKKIQMNVKLLLIIIWIFFINLNYFTLHYLRLFMIILNYFGHFLLF
jgi:hypothetical protein